jgi:hypothetical protein
VPLAQLWGAAPPAQVTWQLFTLEQRTWHAPLHSTSQVVTPAQSISLSGPARTPQRSTELHR